MFLCVRCTGGGVCGPQTDPILDTDGDCVVDSTDNCPAAYNPDQVDFDIDSLGFECDENDYNIACGPITDLSDHDCDTSAYLTQDLIDRDFASLTSGSYRDPSSVSSPATVRDLSQGDCTYYLLSCRGDFLGTLNTDTADSLSVANSTGDFGDAQSVLSIINSLGTFGRTTLSPCSAFNPEAQTPPALMCRTSVSDELAGYLTRNPDVVGGEDTCEVLGQFGITPEACQ